MLDIAFFLTRGFSCHDGHPHIHVIEKDTSNMINDHHTLQFMPLELLSQEHARVVHEHDEARLRQSRQQLMTLHAHVCGRRLQLSAAQMHVAGSPTPYSISQTTLAMSRSKGSQLTEEQGNQIWDIKTAAADFREKITGSREKEPPRPFHPPRGVGPDPRDPRMNPEQWPCYGEHHLGSVRANPHGQWQHCQVCNIRWMYVPRKGSHGQNTKTLGSTDAGRVESFDELGTSIGRDRPRRAEEGGCGHCPGGPCAPPDLQDSRGAQHAGANGQGRGEERRVSLHLTGDSDFEEQDQGSGIQSFLMGRPTTDVKQLLNPKEMDHSSRSSSRNARP